MIAANTTKEVHSNQKIDLTRVRGEVFRGTMDYLLRVWSYIVRISHLVLLISNAIEIAQGSAANTPTCSGGLALATPAG
jgi:hypothetical protein